MALNAWSTSSTAKLDATIQRLQDNDPELTSLFILPNQSLPESQWLKLCDALKVNTHLESLYASGHAIGEVGALVLCEALMDNATLKSVCVGSSSFGDDGLAALSPGLALNGSLRRLDLENKGVSGKGVQTLIDTLGESHSMSELRELSLARNEAVGNDGARALASAVASSANPLRFLEVISLRSTGLTDRSLVPGSLALPISSALRTLDLRKNNFSHPETGGAQPFLALIEAVARASKLESLLVSDCELELVPAVLSVDSSGSASHDAASTVSDRLVAAFKACESLRHLNVSGNLLSRPVAHQQDVDGEDAIAPRLRRRRSAAACLGHACAAAPRLEKLDISSIGLGHGEAEAPASLDVGVAFVEALCEQPGPAQSLQVVDMSKNSLSVTAATAAVLNLRHVAQKLFLTQNKIGDDGVRSVSEALCSPDGARPQTLLLLDLANNGMTEAGAVDLLATVGKRIRRRGDANMDTPSADVPPANAPIPLRVLVVGGNLLGEAGHAAAEALEAEAVDLQIYRGKLEEEDAESQHS